jgi:cold shock protein
VKEVGILNGIMMDQTGLREVRGVVKWYDVTKGFGFVVDDEGDGDILLHANVLRNYGQSSIADGTEVLLLVNDTARGAQAVELLEVLRAPDRNDSMSIIEMPEMEDVDLDSLPLVAARVKWFDRAKGFGFANVFSNNDDVFIHAEVLRRSGLAELMAGEAVALKVFEGRRGLLAIAVYSWDAALTLK